MFSWRAPRRKPLIIAHRGSSAVCPENTLAAFHRAIEDGADAIEFDVRLTKDGEVVVIHDSHLRRTTNGTGKVEEHSLADLKRLSAGGWFSRPFEAERIPTLHEVLRFINGRVGLNIEIKSNRKERAHSPIVERSLQIIHNHHAEKYVLISSFHHHYIKQVKNLRPEIATGALIYPLQHIGRTAISIVKKLNAEYLFFGGASLRKTTVTKAHADNILVGEYTVNTRRRLRRAYRYNVDAVFTDDPSVIIKLMK